MINNLTEEILDNFFKKHLNIFLLSGFFLLIPNQGWGVEKSTESAKVQEEIQKNSTAPIVVPEVIRGIHVTPWIARSKRGRARIEKIFDETEINSVVIVLKEYRNEMFVPGVPLAMKHGFYKNVIPDIKDYLLYLKRKGIYTIVRLVVFKDELLVKHRPDLAVKNPDGSVWKDYAGNPWADPYHKEVWDYNISVATNAVALGFQEVQFDYIRYPSDGKTWRCRYSYKNHNSTSAAENINAFLREASKKIKPLGAKISIDVFGLTPSVPHGMGIGQVFAEMTKWVDYVSPMIYPSHYAKGEYGIPNPDKEPYKVVYRTLWDAKTKLGKRAKYLRPYLQDFSIRHKYGPKEVRAQIEASEELGFNNWLLWNASVRYSVKGLKSKDGTLHEDGVVPPEMKIKPRIKLGKDEFIVKTSTKPELIDEYVEVGTSTVWRKPTENDKNVVIQFEKSEGDDTFTKEDNSFRLWVSSKEKTVGMTEIHPKIDLKQLKKKEKEGEKAQPQKLESTQPKTKKGVWEESEDNE